MYLRKNIIHYTQNDLCYFQTMFASRMECADSGVSVQLLVAYHDDIPLAAMFLVLSAYRAIYLYGASSSSCRNVVWCPLMHCSGVQSRLPRHANVWNMTCSALHPIPTLRIPCTDCTSSSRDLVVTSSISLVAGTILSMSRSTAIWLPVRCRCRAIIARGSANIESIAVWY